MPPTLRDVFRLYGRHYLKQFAGKVLPSHKKAIYDIAKCRTQAAGGHVERCDKCRYKHYVYHSCCNRSCPLCGGLDSQEWLAKRKKEILPLRYFHLVFTLPGQLRSIVRSNQKMMYDLLMKSAVYSLKRLAADPKHLGGKIGIICVLHTWGRLLEYHPHVHCLVPGVAISEDNKYILPTKRNYLVPVKALSKIFRARFLKLAAEALAEEGKKLPFPLPKKWVVYSKPTSSTHQGAETVLRYLARYLYRTAITNNRILSVQGDTITIKFKRVNDKEWKTMTLTVLEFIRRFLQHVLPKGFHKVRFYGFLAPVNRRHLSAIKTFLQLDAKAINQDSRDQQGKPPEPCMPIQGSADSTHHNDHICPKCMKGHMEVWEYFKGKGNPLQGRAPPC